MVGDTAADRMFVPAIRETSAEEESPPKPSPTMVVGIEIEIELITGLLICPTADISGR